MLRGSRMLLGSCVLVVPIAPLVWIALLVRILAVRGIAVRPLRTLPECTGLGGELLCRVVLRGVVLRGVVTIVGHLQSLLSLKPRPSRSPAFSTTTLPGGTEKALRCTYQFPVTVHSARTSYGSGSFDACRWFAGQDDADECAAAGGHLDADGAAVFDHDLPNDGQAETRTRHRT